MDAGLRRVLEKHELEYMQAYNIFVKRKEAELKEFIDDLDSTKGDKRFMDLKIRRLETEKAKSYQKLHEAET
jgi:hypothetical protein